MRYFSRAILSILFCLGFLCTTDLTGPQGPAGPGSIEVYSGLFQASDWVSGAGSGWNISVHIPDTAMVDCVVRKGAGYNWESPYSWSYSATAVHIVDTGNGNAAGAYNGYGYKVTVISIPDSSQ